MKKNHARQLTLKYIHATAYKKIHTRNLKMKKNSCGSKIPHMKGVGMLVVSLRGVNFRFWSRLGCSGQNTIIFSRKSLY